MNVFNHVMYRFSALLLRRVDLAVDLAVEAINLAAAYCFCFLKCPNCCQWSSLAGFFCRPVGRLGQAFPPGLSRKAHGAYL
jgi:hypothetical protein